MPHIIHKDLSYAVRGVLIDVHNALGPTLPERFYQAAVAIGLEVKGIRCEREKEFEVRYRDTQVGRYYVDEWIEDGKLLLELKVAPEITAMHRAQILSYLKVTGADLGIIVNYGAESLDDERLPNYLRDKHITIEWHTLSKPPSTWHRAHNSESQIGTKWMLRSNYAMMKSNNDQYQNGGQ